GARPHRDRARDRSHRALHRRRGLLLRDRGAGRAVREGGRSRSRRRGDRPDRAPDRGRLLRDRARRRQAPRGVAHGGPPLSVSYQGLAGAFSEAAAAALFPDQKLLPRRTFSEVFDALESRRAAERYGLKVLAESIETSPDNFTRFFALARDGDDSVAHRVPAALLTGPWKTSVVYAAANVPGALTRTLQPFATAGVQLTKIESRPSRAGP